ncbi:DUF3347 domain-containing protein [Mucilaginibacter daejeonensis]|uniref:DUF3347 domain-containing protein n=1 Tax=Mucilaginibacter daejeonensis TaxID=398049 RepID=UPI001D1742D2|nr:DUF3347 domain-containing protein [Mucilaginibacter daejeonensis]UEG52160.1 DUF3347 domain-containing protein [Mucilaginibacter daejeonensis]
MKMLQILTFVLLMVTTFQAFAQTDSTLTQRDSVISRRNDTALPAYLALKDALLVSDAKKAASSAQIFANEFIKVRLRSHELNNLMTLKKLRAEAIDEAKAIAATTDINVQRKHFATVSKDFWELAQKYRFIKEAKIYYQQCPMTGVTWVSTSKDIKNPYYPKNMLTCGEVKAQL